MCCNPEQAVRDAAVREPMLGRLQEALEGSDQVSLAKVLGTGGQAQDQPSAGPAARNGQGRVAAAGPGGRRPVRPVGWRYLIRSSDPDRTAGDITVGYKQLPRVERGCRDMKTTPSRSQHRHVPRPTISANRARVWAGPFGGVSSGADRALAVGRLLVREQQPAGLPDRTFGDHGEEREATARGRLWGNQLLAGDGRPHPGRRAGTWPTGHRK